MQQSEKQIIWLFVVRSLLHLEELEVGAESWWCVDRTCTPGQTAFIYKTTLGIVLFLEILEMQAVSESFCKSYEMATARIRVLETFKPYIPSYKLRRSPALLKEDFVRSNFQRKAFTLSSTAISRAIRSLAEIDGAK